MLGETHGTGQLSDGRPTITAMRGLRGALGQGGHDPRIPGQLLSCACSASPRLLARLAALLASRAHRAQCPYKRIGNRAGRGRWWSSTVQAPPPVRCARHGAPLRTTARAQRSCAKHAAHAGVHAAPSHLVAEISTDVVLVRVGLTRAGRDWRRQTSAHAVARRHRIAADLHLAGQNAPGHARG